MSIVTSKPGAGPLGLVRDVVVEHEVNVELCRHTFAESFNGTLRDECLNEHWFTILRDARQKVEAWRRRYSEERPHSSLGGLTLREFAAGLA